MIAFVYTWKTKKIVPSFFKLRSIIIIKALFRSSEIILLFAGEWLLLSQFEVSKSSLTKQKTNNNNNKQNYLENSDLPPEMKWLNWPTEEG